MSEFWKGSFGDSYTARNRVNWRARIPFWRRIMGLTGARSVFEMGCNAGWNLSAIREVAPNARLLGCEINSKAYEQALFAGNDVVLEDGVICLWTYAGVFDLVFTAGVLIHIDEDSIETTMRALVDASADYVLAVEYAADRSQAIEYRGHTDKLWSRPFGRMYEALGLTLMDSGEAEGFDRCQYWLLRK